MFQKMLYFVMNFLHLLCLRCGHVVFCCQLSQNDKHAANIPRLRIIVSASVRSSGEVRMEMELDGDQEDREVVEDAETPYHQQDSLETDTIHIRHTSAASQPRSLIYNSVLEKPLLGLNKKQYI